MAKTQSKDKTPAAEFPLLGHMDELVEGLRKLVPTALHTFDSDAIHQARVSTRRLKASLDLLEPVLSKRTRRPFEKVLRRLRKRLGPLRDMDVMIGHLDEIGANSRHATAAAWLGSRLDHQRTKEREKASGKTVAPRTLGRLGAWWGLREEVIEAREAIHSLLAESLHLQLDAFAEQAGVIACRSRSRPLVLQDPQAVTDASTSSSSDGAPRAGRAANAAALPAKPDDHEPLDVHALRIAGKALRYTLEMAVVEGHALPAGVTKTFKRMQEALGLWHDFVVLTESAMEASLDCGLAHADAALQAEVLELARATLQRSDRELHKFSTLWLDRGQELSRTIRTAFPLTRSVESADVAEPAVDAPAPVTEAQMDPDPCDSTDTSAPAATAPDASSAA